jgi:hypothetical protein
MRDSLEKRVKIALMTDSSQAAWMMVQTGGFQSQVNVSPAPAVEGDFAGANPRFTVLAGPGGLVAGPSGCTIGRFCWFNGPVDPDGTPTQVSSFWNGEEFSGWVAGQAVTQVAGFLHREQQTIIVNYLQDATFQVPQGFPVTLYSGGDFWVKNVGSAEALPGMKAYANLSNGAVTFAVTGSTTQASAFSGTIAAVTSAFTASIAGNLMTVTAIASGGGNIVPGMTLSGTAGGTIAATTEIDFQVSGSIGGTGTYALNIPEQTYLSSTINGSVGQLSVGTLTSGTIGVGQTLTGTGTAANTTITALGTGTGGTGTYFVNPAQTVSNSAYTEAGNVETKWMAASSGLTGELVKITSHVYG